MHFHVPVMYFLPAAVVVVVVVCAQVYMSLLAANSWSTSWMTSTCLPRTHLDLSPLLSSSVCGWTTVSGMTGRNRQSSISRLVLDRFCCCSLAQVRSSARKPWINSKAEFWGDAEFGSENRANRLNLRLLGNQTRDTLIEGNWGHLCTKLASHKSCKHVSCEIAISFQNV